MNTSFLLGFLAETLRSNFELRSEEEVMLKWESFTAETEKDGL